MYSWDSRAPRIVKMVMKHKPDIITFQEARNLDTSQIKIEDFVKMFPGYGYVIWFYNPTKYSFALITMYKLDRFRVEEQVYNYFNNDDINAISENVDEHKNFRGILRVKLFDTQTNKTFCVSNTHLHMGEEEKWKSIRLIINNPLYDTKFPTIIAGDFNLFMDKDGKKMKQFMLETFDNLAEDLYQPNLIDKISGTFFGFPHDRFNCDFNQMNQLDYVWTPRTGNIKLEGKASILVEDDQSLSDRKQPSDHVCIVMVLTIN